MCSINRNESFMFLSNIPRNTKPLKFLEHSCNFMEGECTEMSACLQIFPENNTNEHKMSEKTTNKAAHLNSYLYCISYIWIIVLLDIDVAKTDKRR